MKKSILFLLLFATILMAQYRAEEPQICYKFSKEDFKAPKDIVINLATTNDKLGIVGIDFDASKDNYYRYVCDFDNDDFKCHEINSIEKFKIKMKDDIAYLHIDYLQMYENNEAILHRIKSKNSSFSKGVRTSCFPPIAPIIEVENVRAGSKKEKLLQSININDVIIYDIDYYGELIVAVGEDNSPEIRAEQYSDYAYASLIIISEDGGKTWERVQNKKHTYNNKVIVLENNTIIVSSFGDEVGGSIQVSFDSGLRWKNILNNDDKKIYGDRFTSLEKNNKEIVATRETGVVVKSEDDGKSWYTVEKRKKTYTPATLAVLTMPQYKVDYETNNLRVLHRIKYCDCEQLTLPLTYNQSNTKKGLLGAYWSLGIEDRIDIKDKTELVFFDASKGEKKLYQQDKNDKTMFIYHGSTSIKQTKDGYIRECNKSKHYFNADGFLIKIEYKEKSYKVLYKDKKIDKVEELREGKLQTYISFGYSYEGVTVTFHHSAKKEVVTFLRDKDGLLSSIVDGNKHVFKYTYSEAKTIKDKKLIQIEDISIPYPNSTILEFEFTDLKGEKTTIYDFTRSAKGVVKEESYLHSDGEKKHTCFVTTLTMRMKKELIEKVETKMNVYDFNYYDADKKRLLSTQYKDQVYGFDEIGRLNFYANDDSNVSIRYSDFHKALESLVYKNGKSSEYKYAYTNNSDHKVKTIISPKGLTKLFYDEHNNVVEMKINKYHKKHKYEYHMKYEYNQKGQPIKVISVGKGEIVTSYDDKGNIENIKYVALKDGVVAHHITKDIARSTSLLLERSSAGSIKKYPFWLW